MTSAGVTSADELVSDYLKRLEGELSDLPGDDLPRARRREIVEEVSEHIAEARASGDVQSEAEVLTLLDRIGEPDEIAAEAQARLDIPPAKPGWREVWTLILLGAGGSILPLVGWFLGAWLLWGSPVWSRKEKLIGTLATMGLAPGLWIYLQLGITPSDDTPSTSELVFQWSWTLMIFVGLAAITYLAVRLRRRSKLAARLVAFHSGHKKERIMNTPVLLLWLLALGLLAGGVQNLVRGDDGRSEADLKEDVTKVGNDWAPLFAKDALAACDFMYTPSSPPGPLCVEFFRTIGPRRPTQFQKSFENATVESVAIIDYDSHRAEGTRALAEFSNGELVEFLQTLSAGGNPERGRSVGWFISDLGPSVGKKYKAEAAGLQE